VKWVAILALVLVAAGLLCGPGVTLDMWEDENILEEAEPSMGLPEFWVNNDCMVGGPWDRWHDACNARQVKII